MLPVMGLLQFTHSWKAAFAIWCFDLTTEFQPGILNLPSFFLPVVSIAEDAAASRALVSSAYKFSISFRCFSSVQSKPFLMQQGSTNTKVQFVLCDTKGGGLSTESLINHLKSKHSIHVIHEGEDHKIIQTWENLITNCEKRKESFWGHKDVKQPWKTFHAFITIKPKSLEPERAFSATGLFVAKLRYRLNDESVLWLSCVL